MNAQEWAAAKTLLVEAAALPEAARAALVEARCADPKMRAELLAMLASPASLSDIVDPPVFSPGTTLGRYVVHELRGAGGMGQVYRARDTNLERDVAIKVLPSEVAGNPDRLRRFEREAQLLAAVNHPHIATIHGLEEADGLRFAVMELIEGESLAERLGRRRLPLPQALAVAIDIGEALTAAHRAGIVHRDVKPANIMLTATGAKLLDFGLARGSTSADGLVAHPITRTGAVMGTLPYMAPEQMEGRRADERSDIFSLGCVLYEMLTGARPFIAATGSALADVASLRGSIGRVVMRCLATSPDDRWQTAADLVAELRWVAERSSRRRRRRAARAAALLAAVSMGAAAVWFGARARHVPAVQIVRAEVGVAPAEELDSSTSFLAPDLTPGGARTAFSWTADGRSIVFIGRVARTRQIYIRPLEAAQAQPVSGTEGAVIIAAAPDGGSVAFAARGWIRLAALPGGPAMDLTAELDKPPMGLACAAGGRVFFTGRGFSVWEVRPGRAATPLTTLADDERAHVPSSVLPGDRALLYTVRKREWTWGDEEVVAIALDTGERKVLLRDAADARYVPPGYLVFARRGVLMAVPFDVARLIPTGPPAPVLEGVAEGVVAARTMDATGTGQYSVSADGSLAFVAAGAPAPPLASLVSVDLSGNVTDLGAPVRSYGWGVRVSPDGQRLAVTIGTLEELGLWLYDLRRPGALTPLPRTGEASWPVWSRDGEQIVFKWLENGRYSLGAQRVDGGVPPVAVAKGEFTPSSWAPGGALLGMIAERQVGVAAGATIAPVAHLQETASLKRWPEVSPDGKWLAYGGGGPNSEIYVEPYPGPGPRVQLSVGGGHTPVWHPSGRQLFYVNSVGSGRYGFMTVAFTPGVPSHAGQPRLLFEFDPFVLALSCDPVRCFDVAPDGRKLYAMRFERSSRPRVTHINLIQNWIAEVKDKVPAR